MTSINYDIGYDTVLKQFLQNILVKAIPFYDTFLSEFGYNTLTKTDHLNFIRVSMRKPNHTDLTESKLTQSIAADVQVAFDSKNYYKYSSIGYVTKNEEQEIGTFTAGKGVATKDFILGLVEDRLLSHPRTSIVTVYIIGPSDQITSNQLKTSGLISVQKNIAMNIQRYILKSPVMGLNVNDKFHAFYSKL